MLAVGGSEETFLKQALTTYEIPMETWLASYQNVDLKVSKGCFLHFDLYLEFKYERIKTKAEGLEIEVRRHQRKKLKLMIIESAFDSSPFIIKIED